MQTDFTPDYDLIFISQSETLIHSDSFIGSRIRTKLSSEVRIARYLIFCVMFCRSVFFLVVNHKWVKRFVPFDVKFYRFENL